MAAVEEGADVLHVVLVADLNRLCWVGHHWEMKPMVHDIYRENITNVLDSPLIVNVFTYDPGCDVSNVQLPFGVPETHDTNTMSLVWRKWLRPSCLIRWSQLSCCVQVTSKEALEQKLLSGGCALMLAPTGWTTLDQSAAFHCQLELFHMGILKGCEQLQCKHFHIQYEH